MSITNRVETGGQGPPQPSPLPSVVAGVDRAIEIAGQYLADLIGRAAPAPTVLRALTDELQRATNRPGGVAHPELLDPTVYWEKSAWPQAAAMVKQARSALLDVVAEIEPVVVGSERVLTDWLASHVAEAATQRAGAEIERDATIDVIASRCEFLHRTIERLAVLRPTSEVLDAARTGVERARRHRAEDDVRATRADLEASTAHLDREQFKQFWSDTFDQRVAARDAELRALVPFRHQDLLLAAHEQALDAIADDVAAMVVYLTAPIFGIGERLVRRLDELTVEYAHPRR